MKKIVMMALLAFGVIQVEAADQDLRIKTMQNLEKGMETILKGMMYNNKSIILKGVDAIKDNTKNIALFNIKNDEGVNFKAKKYSETEAKALGGLAEKILNKFSKGEKSRSLDYFKRLQNQCINCHALIRKW